MEDQDYIQQCIHTFTLSQSVAQKILKENSPKTNIKSMSKNYCGDASSEHVLEIFLKVFSFLFGWLFLGEVILGFLDFF